MAPLTAFAIQESHSHTFLDDPELGSLDLLGLSVTGNLHSRSGKLLLTTQSHISRNSSQLLRAERRSARVRPDYSEGDSVWHARTLSSAPQRNMSHGNDPSVGPCRQDYNLEARRLPSQMASVQSLCQPMTLSSRAPLAYILNQSGPTDSGIKMEERALRCRAVTNGGDSLRMSDMPRLYASAAMPGGVPIRSEGGPPYRRPLFTARQGITHFEMTPLPKINPPPRKLVSFPPSDGQLGFNCDQTMTTKSSSKSHDSQQAPNLPPQTSNSLIPFPMPNGDRKEAMEGSEMPCSSKASTSEARVNSPTPGRGGGQNSRGRSPDPTGGSVPRRGYWETVLMPNVIGGNNRDQLESSIKKQNPCTRKSFIPWDCSLWPYYIYTT